MQQWTWISPVCGPSSVGNWTQISFTCSRTSFTPSCCLVLQRCLSMQYGSVDMGDSVQEWEWYCWTQMSGRGDIPMASEEISMHIFWSSLQGPQRLPWIQAMNSRDDLLVGHKVQPCVDQWLASIGNVNHNRAIFYTLILIIVGSDTIHFLVELHVLEI